MKNIKTGPVIKDYHALKERKQDCIGNLRSSHFYTFVYRKVCLYSMRVYRCNVYNIYIWNQNSVSLAHSNTQQGKAYIVDILKILKKFCFSSIFNILLWNILKANTKTVKKMKH